MGLFRKINKMAADGRRAEEALYEMALQELTADDIRPGLWAKAFAESDGEEAKTRATYLKLRVQQMRDELVALDSAARRVGAEWGPLERDTPPSDKPPASAAPRASTTSTEAPSVDATALATSSSGAAVGLVFLGGIAALGVLSIVVASRVEPGNPPHPPGSMSIPASTPAEPILPPPRTPPGSTAYIPSDQVFSTTDLHALIPDEAQAVATIGGRLSIQRATEFVSGLSTLTLDGQPIDLPASHMALLSITRHSNQDIVLVGMNCGGTACTYLDMAFVRVFSDRPPVIETQESFRFPQANPEPLLQGISIRGEKTEVALGLDHGAHVFASIGPDSPLVVTRERATLEPLSPEDCSAVNEYLHECADFTPSCTAESVAAFPDNCAGASLAFNRGIGYFSNHTAGFNAPRFANACTAASRLGIAPSTEFVAREICSGADPSQWTTAKTAATSVEETSASE